MCKSGIESQYIPVFRHTDFYLVDFNYVPTILSEKKCILLEGYQ